MSNNANFAAKKSHTSLGVRSVLPVDAREGRVASVAINLPAIYVIDNEKNKDPGDVSLLSISDRNLNLRSEI